MFICPSSSSVEFVKLCLTFPFRFDSSIYIVFIGSLKISRRKLRVLLDIEFHSSGCFS